MQQHYNKHFLKYVYDKLKYMYRKKLNYLIKRVELSILMAL